MTRFIVGVFLVVVTVVQSRHEKYEGHTLYQIVGPAQEISFLEGHLDILSAKPAINSISNNSRHLDALLRLSPDEKLKWLPYFDQKNVHYKLVAENLAEILRLEDIKVQESRSNASRGGRSISWDTYYNHEEINNHLDELGAKYPDLVTVINAALSYEGRQIKYVRISSSRFEDLRKRVIIIDAAVHAREWVTPPVALYIINQLVVDIVDRKLTEQLDWIIIPVVNPDGYEYTIHEDRMWRKTRSKQHVGGDECPGVDGNRNYDHVWGTRIESSDPCSIVYEGPSPFSESETRVVRDVVRQNIDRASLYISLHSFGNMFLYAWGHDGTLPPNGLSLHLAGITMATAIDKLKLDKARPYIVGNAASVLYFTSGTSRDWTRAAGVPLTFTLELPGYDYGFVVPPEYIEQIVTETWAGIAEGARYVLSLYG